MSLKFGKTIRTLRLSKNYLVLIKKVLGKNFREIRKLIFTLYLLRIYLYYC